MDNDEVKEDTKSNDSTQKTPDTSTPASPITMTTTTIRPSDLVLPAHLKLVGLSNLKVWKSLMEVLLAQNGLTEHIDPLWTKSGSADEKGNNATVKMCICTNIAGEFIPLVMEHETAAKGYADMCRFIEGDSIAALKTAHRDYVNLADTFDKYSMAADYILAHKSVIDRLKALDHGWDTTMYSIHFICAVASKYPQWAANQDYLMTTATKDHPSPSLETLYMTLQDHIRLQEVQALNAPPAQQAYNANKGGNRPKEREEGQRWRSDGRTL